ncbi:MAG: pyruvate dehydrogenase [Acidobacteria bacterium]|nr:pyruvate dehydrogenase [Acidobacteriota bacterium]
MSRIPELTPRHVEASQELSAAAGGVMYAEALLIRRFEERLLQLFSEGQLFGTVHTCIGQELSGLAVARHLAPGDQVFSNHRCHGHYLARTGDVEGLLAEIMGRVTGVCGGRGGSQHICRDGFFSNGVQGGIVPIAAGLALAHQQRGLAHVVVVFIGDGTLGEGVVYETMNIASKWRLPLCIVLENNLYAQSTPQAETLAGGVLERAMAFGLHARAGSTWQPEELADVVGASLDHVRSGRGPAFVKIDTYRLMAHSKGDDDRDRAEVEAYWAKDPVALFLSQHAQAQALDADIRDRLDRAVATARQAPFSTAGGGDVPERIADPVWVSASRPRERARVVETLRASFDRNMARDARIVLLGEDIRSPYGGAFKVTRGLSDRHPARVLNTPISEAAIVGLGIGLAMNGLRPVCEIMFGDFLTLAADQIINHASKFPYMYNGQVQVPLIVRTPMGGKRGYGPTHSQSLEKHFLGLPQTQVLAIHHRYDPGRVYDELFDTLDRFALVIENKLLYAQRLAEHDPDGFVVEHTAERFPVTRIRSDLPPDVTVLCYGGMLVEVEQAIETVFDQEEIVAEVICPVQLYPFDCRPVVESVRASGRLLIVEEGMGFSAFGAEVVAQIVEARPGAIRHLKRLSAPPHPLPSCGPLEAALLAGPASIHSAIVEIVRGA